MSVVTRLEAPFSSLKSIPIFRIKIPHDAVSWTDIALTDSILPTHYHLCRAIEAAVFAATTYGPADSSFYLTQNYTTGTIAWASDTVSFQIDFTDAETEGQTALRDYWNISAATITTTAEYTTGIPPSFFQVDHPIHSESYTLGMDRVANFADSGRVSAALINRHVRYSFALTWTNADHDAWLDFARWLVQGRRAAVWNAWDTVDGDNNNYQCRPYPGTWGWKLLNLDGGADWDLDSPRTGSGSPNVIGHSRNLQGVIYGI